MQSNRPPKPMSPQIEKPNESQGRDFFQTPNYALDILLPFIPKSLATVWDCACGKNKIVDYFHEQGYFAFGTDILTDYALSYFNFVEDNLYGNVQNTVIITNPPYSLKRKFYEKCKEYSIPFALLIPADYCLWLIDAIRVDGCEKIIPDRRIDFITPTGRSGETSSAYYHSMWLTWGFGLGRTETFVELTKEMKKNI